MKINWLLLVLSSICNSLSFFGKSALFVNTSFEQLPQSNFGLARCLQVWCKVALEVWLSL
ncbi:TPA: hypothetical protein I7680_21790 [Vibrio vulnificus]|nr:hypothetical protein DC357_21590 [Vibrio vulnificus]HAS8174098.1 hypothetical protein [Vibrio vulnificus]HAS8448038.1 hypothetical protein [Vibrio vulnificus]HAS8457174.1 hypothetical protein [Vibrio vulnificus]